MQHNYVRSEISAWWTYVPHVCLGDMVFVCIRRYPVWVSLRGQERILVTTAPAMDRVSRDSVSAALSEIEQMAAGIVQQGDRVCSAHANTLTWVAAQPPDAVVLPRSTAELADIVRIAARHKVPLIGFGGGTSLEGHVNAPVGGLSIDFARMDKVTALSSQDLTMRVGAGVTLSALNRYLADTPLFFSVDPGAGEATLGGMAATRASGTNTVLYGTMRENVQSLEVVMSDGRVIETATAAPKSAAGYDLTHLFVGSEGTLGLISALTLKLHPVPQETAVVIASFKTLNAACETVIAGIGSGLKPARIELLDDKIIHAINRHSATDLPERPAIFIEFHGRTGETVGLVQAFKRLAEKHLSTAITSALEPAQCATLWQARHHAFSALNTVWPGATVLATDVCVPVSRLSDALQQAQADIKQLDLIAPIVGHVGDGNFHVLPVFDHRDDQKTRAVRELLDRLVASAHRFGGTCSGEHGIGQGKIDYLAQEAGTGISVMRDLKRALDPLNILNPGKIVRL